MVIKLNEDTVSAILGALIIVLVGFLILNYFRSYEPEDKVEACSKIETLEGIKDKVYVYKLENGRRVETPDLYQDGEVYCYTP